MNCNKKNKPVLIQSVFIRALSCPGSWGVLFLSWSSDLESQLQIWVQCRQQKTVDRPVQHALGSSNMDTSMHLRTQTCRAECDRTLRHLMEKDKKVPDHSLLDVFLRFSTGLKQMVGMGQTICMGLASTRHEFALSQPAPSRYKPLIYTPSWRGKRQRGKGNKLTNTNDKNNRLYFMY